MTNAARLHCHSVPNAGSDIGCCRAKAMAPAANVMPAGMAIIPHLRAMNPIDLAPFPLCDQFLMGSSACSLKVPVQPTGLFKTTPGRCHGRCDHVGIIGLFGRPLMEKVAIGTPGFQRPFIDGAAMARSKDQRSFIGLQL